MDGYAHCVQGGEEGRTGGKGLRVVEDALIRTLTWLCGAHVSHLESTFRPTSRNSENKKTT